METKENKISEKINFDKYINTLSDKEIEEILNKSTGLPSKEAKEILSKGLPDDEVKKVLEKYPPDEKDDTLSPLGLSAQITCIELENLDIEKTIDKLNIKISKLIEQKDLIELEYKQVIWDSQNKKTYPNEGSRETALKEQLEKHPKYKLIVEEINIYQKEVSELKYKSKKNVIFKNNYGRIYDIGMRPVHVIDTNTKIPIHKCKFCGESGCYGSCLICKKSEK